MSDSSLPQLNGSNNISTMSNTSAEVASTSADSTTNTEITNHLPHSQINQHSIKINEPQLVKLQDPNTTYFSASSIIAATYKRFNVKNVEHTPDPLVKNFDLNNTINQNNPASNYTSTSIDVSTIITSNNQINTDNNNQETLVNFTNSAETSLESLPSYKSTEIASSRVSKNEIVVNNQNLESSNLNQLGTKSVSTSITIDQLQLQQTRLTTDIELDAKNSCNFIALNQSQPQLEFNQEQQLINTNPVELNDVTDEVNVENSQSFYEQEYHKYWRSLGYPEEYTIEQIIQQERDKEYEAIIEAANRDREIYQNLLHNKNHQTTVKGINSNSTLSYNNQFNQTSSKSATNQLDLSLHNSTNTALSAHEIAQQLIADNFGIDDYLNQLREQIDLQHVALANSYQQDQELNLTNSIATSNHLTTLETADHTYLIEDEISEVNDFNKIQEVIDIDLQTQEQFEAQSDIQQVRGVSTINKHPISQNQNHLNRIDFTNHKIPHFSFNNPVNVITNFKDSLHTTNSWTSSLDLSPTVPHSIILSLEEEFAQKQQEELDRQAEQEKLAQAQQLALQQTQALLQQQGIANDNTLHLGTYKPSIHTTTINRIFNQINTNQINSISNSKPTNSVNQIKNTQEIGLLDPTKDVDRQALLKLLPPQILEKRGLLNLIKDKNHDTFKDPATLIESHFNLPETEINARNSNDQDITSITLLRIANLVIDRTIINQVKTVTKPASTTVNAKYLYNLNINEAFYEFKSPLQSKKFYPSLNGFKNLNAANFKSRAFQQPNLVKSKFDLLSNKSIYRRSFRAPDGGLPTTIIAQLPMIPQASGIYRYVAILNITSNCKTQLDGFFNQSDKQQALFIPIFKAQFKELNTIICDLIDKYEAGLKHGSYSIKDLDYIEYQISLSTITTTSAISLNSLTKSIVPVRANSLVLSNKLLSSYTLTSLTQIHPYVSYATPQSQIELLALAHLNTFATNSIEVVESKTINTEAINNVNNISDLEILENKSNTSQIQEALTIDTSKQFDNTTISILDEFLDPSVDQQEQTSPIKFEQLATLNNKSFNNLKMLDSIDSISVFDQLDQQDNVNGEQDQDYHQDLDKLSFNNPEFDYISDDNYLFDDNNLSETQVTNLQISQNVDIHAPAITTTKNKTTQLTTSYNPIDLLEDTISIQEYTDEFTSLEDTIESLNIIEEITPIQYSKVNDLDTIDNSNSFESHLVDLDDEFLVLDNEFNDINLQSPVLQTINQEDNITIESQELIASQITPDTYSDPEVTTNFEIEPIVNNPLEHNLILDINDSNNSTYLLDDLDDELSHIVPQTNFNYIDSDLNDLDLSPAISLAQNDLKELDSNSTYDQLASIDTILEEYLINSNNKNTKK